MEGEHKEEEDQVEDDEWRDETDDQSHQCMLI